VLRSSLAARVPLALLAHGAGLGARPRGRRCSAWSRASSARDPPGPWRAACCSPRGSERCSAGIERPELGRALTAARCSTWPSARSWAPWSRCSAGSPRGWAGARGPARDRARSGDRGRVFPGRRGRDRAAGPWSRHSNMLGGITSGGCLGSSLTVRHDPSQR
jgi:hypothetical protein